MKNANLFDRVLIKISNYGLLFILIMVFHSAYTHDAHEKRFYNSYTISIPDRKPIPIKEDDIKWLALNIYFEARGDGEASRKGVIDVTLNRLYDYRYPNNIESVVTSYKQFSWYWDGLSDTPTDKKAWVKALKLSKTELEKYRDGTYIDSTHGSTHYHKYTIKPKWTKWTKWNKVKYVTTIASHLYYKWI